MGAPQGTRAFEAAVRNPALGAASILRDRAEASLIEFIRLTWHLTDPGQPLRVGRAMEAIAEHLEAVHRGQIRNLLINCPPGFSKSTLVNVSFPAWEWGPRRRPDLRYLSWAYGEHLTVRDNDKCATIINSPLYQALWGGRFKWDPRQNAKDFYRNSDQGFRIASGVRGMGTGERGDRLHVDDPHSVAGAESEADLEFTQNWFAATLTSRVRNANPYEEVVDGVLVQPSSTIVIMQRLKHRDVAGIILENELDFEHLLIEMEFEGDAHPVRARKSKKRPGQLAWKGSSIGYVDWRVALLREIDHGFPGSSPGVSGTVAHEARYLDCTDEDDLWWYRWGKTWLDIGRDIATLADPVRYSRAAVEEQREKLLLSHGSNAVAAQFRQYPHEGSGDMFKPEDWLWCEADEVPPARTMFDVRGWDLAASDRATSDGTGAVKIRWAVDNYFYILHAERVRLGPGGVKTFRERIREMDGPTCIQDFPQDPGQAGVDQVQGFAAEAPGTVTRSSPESGSKIVRASPMSGMQQHHRVKIVRGPWNAELVDEYKDFPNGNFSALVDGGSRAFNRLARSQALRIPGGTSVIGAQLDKEAAAAAMTAAMESKPRLNMSVRGRPEIDEDIEDLDE